MGSWLLLKTGYMSVDSWTANAVGEGVEREVSLEDIRQAVDRIKPEQENQRKTEGQ